MAKIVIAGDAIVRHTNEKLGVDVIRTIKEDLR